MASPFLILPDPRRLFCTRARRFRQLADSQPSLASYLNLMADLSDIQQGQATDLYPRLPPDSRAGRLPLDLAAPPRPMPWCTSIRHIAEGVGAGTEPLAGIRRRIEAASDETLESWADAFLKGDVERLDPGLALFLGVALQIQWTLQASRQEANASAPAESGHLCPVCGFLPVAAVLQTGGDVHGLRYLVCGLCGTGWHRPRSQCVHCGSGKEMVYYGIDGATETVQAEACGDCRVYLKIMNREKDTELDPWADDLASLSLDLLMAEEGYQRLGFNPLLIPGGNTL
jgi:FdhE protein